MASTRKRGKGKKISWDIVQNCGNAQCNIKETAAILGVSEVTLRERCLEENGTDIKSFIKEAHVNGKACLRRRLYKMANDGKNWPALKFALSNYLKMYEKNELEVIAKRAEYTDEEREMLHRLALEKAKQEIEANGGNSLNDAELNFHEPWTGISNV